MKFIALKNENGSAKGRISFLCEVLEVKRKKFHKYLKKRNNPRKHE